MHFMKETNSAGDLSFGHHKLEALQLDALNRLFRDEPGAALQAGPAPGKGAHRVRRVKAVGAQGPPRPSAHKRQEGPLQTLGRMGRMASHPRSSAHRRRRETLGSGPRGRGGRSLPTTSRRVISCSPARAPRRTRGSKHRDVISVRLRLRLPLRSPSRGGRSPLRSARGHVYVPVSHRRGQGARAARGGRAAQRSPGRAAFGCSHRGQRCGSRDAAPAGGTDAWGFRGARKSAGGRQGGVGGRPQPAPRPPSQKRTLRPVGALWSGGGRSQTQVE